MEIKIYGAFALNLRVDGSRIVRAMSGGGQGRRVDPAINDKGMLEASCLAVALRSLETPVVASSELLRAKMTADRVASLHPGAKRVVIFSCAPSSAGTAIAPRG